MRLCSYCVSRSIAAFCAPFPCYIFPRWRRPRPHAAFPSWIYAATERQNELAKTARSVSPLVSFCVVPPRLVLRLVPPSRHASRLVSCRLVVSLLSSREAERSWRVVLSVSFCLIVLARASLPSCVVSHCRLVLRCVGTGRACVFFVPCRRAFHVVSFHPFVVGVGVSLRGLCGEIELTKTARFTITVVSVSSGSCSSCRGDGNRTRSNGSDTRGRCRSVRMPGRSYMPAGRFRKTILTLAPPTPGGGGLFKACG